MRKPRDVIDVTPVKEANGTPPMTRGSLQWFQQKQQRWKQSPRGSIVALPRSPALQQNMSSSSTKSSTPKKLTASKAPSFSLAPRSFSFQTANATSNATPTTTPQSLFPPNPSGSKTPSPFAESNSGFFFPAPAAPKSSLGASPFQQQSTPSFSFASSASSGSSKSPATTSVTPFSTFGISSGAAATTTTNNNIFAAAPKREPPPAAVPSATAPAKEDKNTNHRERLLQFYKTHNPSKIDTVDATLANYRGKEEVLFRKLEEKYVSGKDGMLPPSGTGPTCYLDISIDDGTSSSGRVTVKLYQDKAQLACENFRCLCTGEKGTGRSTKELCYRGSRVHRIVPNFVVQMGDFTKGDGTGGESIYPPNSEHGDMWGKFKDETPFLMHARKGLLSMANNGPNKNGSQFFITLKAIPHLDGKHVVFGEVVSGMEIVEKMGQLETDKEQRPLTSVAIQGCGQLGDDGKDINKTVSKTQPSTSTSQQTFGFGTASAASFGGGFAANTTLNQQSPFGASGTKPNPFGASAKPASGGSSAFPPMAMNAPTPFGASTKPALGGSSAFPPMATKAPTPFGTAAKPSSGSSSAFPPMATEAPTPFSAAAKPSSGSSSVFSPMSTKVPSPFGVAAKPSSGSSSAFPPMATKAPTPFGGAAAKPSLGSSSAFPPMATTPFGAAAKPASGSSSAFPPMATKAPTPFGAATKPSSGSSSAFPSMATKSPTPFGVSTEPASEGSSAFPPMAMKAPTPFGAAAKSSSGSSSAFPPMSSTAPSNPFAAFSSQSEKRKSAQGVTAPSSSVSGNAFQSTTQKQQGQSPFSLGAAQYPDAQPNSQNVKDAKTAVPAFSFGKVCESNGHSKNEMTSSEVPKLAFSFGVPKSTPETTPAAPAFSFGHSVFTQSDKPSSSAASFTFGAPAMAGSDQSQPKASMAATKSTTLPSFYFGQEKTGAVSSGASKTVVKAADVKVEESKEASVPGTSSGQSKSTETTPSKLDDVSFASFSPNFMHRSEDTETSTVNHKVITHSSKDADQKLETRDAASNSSRGDKAGGEVSASTEDVFHVGNPDMMSTPAKPKDGASFHGNRLEAITPQQKNTTATTTNTRLWMTEVKPPRPKGMQRGFYSTPSRKQPRDIAEAVADILAERVFSDDELLSEVSVEAVEKVMALPVEMMIAVLEHIDKIESSGASFTWNDIQAAIKENQGTVKALNFDDQSFASFDDFRSCVSRLTAASGKRPINASQEDGDDLSCSSSARGAADRSRFGIQRGISSDGEEGDEEEEDLELLIQNLEFLN